MTQPIGPSDSANSVPAPQSPQEKQKLFELQFQIAVISDYIAVSGQNGSTQQQLNQLKKGLESGQPPDQLASNLNQLISQINNSIIPGKAAFPTFSFSSTGSQVQAITHYAISLEKFLNTAAEKGIINWPNEQKLFKELSSLIENVGQLTPEQAFNKLNELIEEANADLPTQYKLPKIATQFRR